MSALEPTARKSSRGLVAALLLVLPLLTLWNLYALPNAPKLRAMIGRLHGVTEPETPVKFSLNTFTDGSWQKYMTSAVSDAYPLRPILIQLNNQLRYKLFGAYAAPGLVVGDNDQLIERLYLDEYCRRNLAAFEPKAREWSVKLKELQDFFESRGHVFIYLITPSKAAYMPENFFPRLPCASTGRDRAEKLPLYKRILAVQGVHVVDAATLTYEAKGKYKVDIFPQGGVHWNAIGVANAANAILGEINSLEKADIAPKLVWRYEVTNRAKGEDRDLANLINVLRPNIRYATAAVTYDRTRPCEDFPISRKSVAMIGGSFISTLGRTLAREGCLAGLGSYNYLYRGLRTGPANKEVKRRLTAADIVPLRDADIVILEENDAVFPSSAHAQEFYRVILGK